MKKKMIPFLLTAAMLTQAIPVFAAGDITAFTDYNQNLGYGQLSAHWAKNSITTLMAHDGINGYPEGDFRANKEISAAELIAILLNVSEHADELTGETWAEKIMNRAYELGICKNTEIPLAEANKPISREKMALVLVNSAEKLNDEDTTALKLIDYTTIYDLDKAHVFYQNAIVKAYSMGLLAGTGINYQPKASTTRAEATAIVNRLMGYSDRVDAEKAQADRVAEKARQEEIAKQKAVEKEKVYSANPNIINDDGTLTAEARAVIEKILQEPAGGKYDARYYSVDQPYAGLIADDGIISGVEWKEKITRRGLLGAEGYGERGGATAEDLAGIDSLYLGGSGGNSSSIPLFNGDWTNLYKKN